MISLIDITHFSGNAGRGTLLFCGLSLRVRPGDRIGILAPAGSGKTTLCRLLLGSLAPDMGTVMREGTVSWPLNSSGLLHPELSALANLRLIAGCKNLDADAVTARVEAIAGTHDLDRPIVTLPPARKLQYAVATTLSIPFDYYLADEMPSLPQGEFADRFEATLALRLRQAGMILITRHAAQLKRHSTRFFVLSEGQLLECESADMAADLFTCAQKRTLTHAEYA